MCERDKIGADFTSTPLLTIAPTRRELGGLGCGNEYTRANVVGMGRAAGDQVACLLDSTPCKLLVSLGYAGALEPGLHTGDLVVGSAFQRGQNPIVPGSSQAAHAASLLRQAGRTVLEGMVLTVDEPLLTPRAKRRAQRGSRAMVVDMEGQWIADAASSRDVPFIGIRAVLDELDYRLPSFIATIIADQDRREWIHAVRAMRQPSVVGSFLPLALKSREASRALRLAAQNVLPEVAQQQ